MRFFKNDRLIHAILITVTLIVSLLGIKIITLNINAAANNSTIYGEEKNDNPRKNIYIYIFNKSMPILSLENDQNLNILSFSKGLINKFFSFDYRDPKTYLSSQIPIFKEFERELNMVSTYKIHDEDYDTRSIEIIKKDDDKSNSNIGKQVDNGKAENIKAENDSSRNSGNYEVINIDKYIINDDIEIVLTPVPSPKAIHHNMDDPLILIYHTHGTESYKPENTGNYHSLNRQYTVIRVGEELKKALESRGYKTIHDDTLHDYPSYQGSYSRSLSTLEKNLNTYKSIKVIFDIHRDGIDHIDSLDNHDELRNNFLVEINGEKVARYSLVIGEQNENVKELKKFLYYIKSVSDELYPGLCSRIISKDFKYNQYKSDYYALIEIGSNANTIEESLRTARYLGEIIAKALNGFVVKE